MIYASIVKRLVMQSFDHVNNRRWDALLAPTASNIHHRFAGVHSLGGERHDRETLRRWFERLGRVLPTLRLNVLRIWVKGFPWETTALVQWEARATLADGDASYYNRGLHVITLRWGKVHAIEVYEDSQAVARALATQAAAGIAEAAAAPIVS